MMTAASPGRKKAREQRFFRHAQNSEISS